MWFGALSFTQCFWMSIMTEIEWTVIFVNFHIWQLDIVDFVLVTMGLISVLWVSYLRQLSQFRRLLSQFGTLPSLFVTLLSQFGRLLSQFGRLLFWFGSLLSQFGCLSHFGMLLSWLVVCCYPGLMGCYTLQAFCVSLLTALFAYWGA